MIYLTIRCNEIEAEIANIKKSKEKWVNLSSVLSAFENAQKISSESASCFNTKSIKFSKLAGNIICNRMRHMDELSQPDRPRKSTGQAIVAEDNVKQREERGKRKKAEVEAREERKAKEEAQARVEEVQAKNEAYESLLLQIKRGDLPLSALQDMDIESLVAGPSQKK